MPLFLFTLQLLSYRSVPMYTFPGELYYIFHDVPFSGKDIKKYLFKTMVFKIQVSFFGIFSLGSNGLFSGFAPFCGLDI